MQELRGWFRLFGPWTDGGDHAIAESWNCGDVGGLFWVVAEETAERSYGLVDGVGGDDDVGPDLIEQFIDADDFAGMFGEAEEQAHGSRLDAGCLFIARDLAGGWIDAPVADAKHCRGWGFHAGADYSKLLKAPMPTQVWLFQKYSG